MGKKWLLWTLLLGLLIPVGVYLIYRYVCFLGGRTPQVIRFLRHPEDYPRLILPAGTRCGDAPFALPSRGMIGFVWGDSFRPGHRHSGIDIFSGKAVGEEPVYAAYDGYLTRLEEWKASVIIRIPSDPLQPETQVWTYYTHLADRFGNTLISDDFPPGTSEVYVTAGTLLGYQGNYSGTFGKPTGIHLHFSIVRDNGKGQFLNELEINNTLDPSPYFGLQLNARENKEQIPLCAPP